MRQAEASLRNVGHGTSNAILARLSRDDFNRVSTRLTRIRLAPGQVLIEADAPLNNIFFLESGLATLLAKGDECAPSQLAMVGREGGLGLLELVTGSSTAFATIVTQVGGTAVRIPMHEVPSAMHEAPALDDASCRYVRALTKQIMETAACNARDTLLQRCARWLVMAHSRLNSDDISVTHAALAMMLGVRRSGVTVAMEHLQRRGLVQAHRGVIKILDAVGLRSAVNVPILEHIGEVGANGRHRPGQVVQAVPVPT